jgi:hypothetical protein
MIKEVPDASPSNGKLLKKIQKTANSNMKYSSTILWRISFLFLSVIIFTGSGCKDPDDEIALDILPAGDQLQTLFTDTATVLSSIAIQDSLRGDELSIQLLGSGNDPVFGINTASFYTQAVLQGTPVWGTAPQADSLVLNLRYSGYYGDTTAIQTLSVYRVTDIIYIDSLYYTDKNFATEATALATFQFAPQPNTAVVLDSDTLAPHIRIRLSQVLADSLVLLSGQNQFSSNTAWLDYFRGLFIKADPVASEGAISYINLLTSVMTLYYHDSANTAKTYNFSLFGARVNHYDHDYSASPVGMQLIDPNTDSAFSYVQTMSGVETNISFPYLKHFLDSGSILINKAEVTISIPNTVPVLYPLPSRLFLITRDATGTEILPIDANESTLYYGGYLNSSSTAYTFNIQRQLQGYLDNRYPSAEFKIIPANNGVTANRAVIGSAKSTDYRLKLSLYYTRTN